jgi:two-component system chemotaxis sensor kinase CheA
MVDVLLQSGDALRAQLARHQGGGGPEIDTTELLFNIPRDGGRRGRRPPFTRWRWRSRPPLAEPAAEPTHPSAANRTEARSLEVRVGPLDNPAQADNLVELFQEIVDLGTIEPIDGGQSVDGMRRFKITTSAPTATCWTCSPSTSRVTKSRCCR